MQWRRVAIGRAAEAHERDVRPDVHLVRPQLRVAMALPKGEVARARRSAKAMEGGRSGGDASRTFPKEPWLGGTCAMQTETETKCARKSSKVIQKVPGGTRRPWKVRGKAVEDRWEGCGRGRSEGKPWKTDGKAVEGQWEGRGRPMGTSSKGIQKVPSSAAGSSTYTKKAHGGRR